jgi:hypothetical protein
MLLTVAVALILTFKVCGGRIGNVVDLFENINNVL